MDKEFRGMVLDEAVYLGWRFSIEEHQGPVYCVCGQEAEDEIYIVRDEILCKDCFLDRYAEYPEMEKVRDEYEELLEQSRDDRMELEREYRRMAL